MSWAIRLGHSSDYLSIANQMVDYIFPPLLSIKTQKFSPFFRSYLTQPLDIGESDPDINEIRNSMEKELVDKEMDDYCQRSMRFNKLLTGKETRRGSLAASLTNLAKFGS